MQNTTPDQSSGHQISPDYSKLPSRNFISRAASSYPLKPKKRRVTRWVDISRKIQDRSTDVVVYMGANARRHELLTREEEIDLARIIQKGNIPRIKESTEEDAETSHPESYYPSSPEDYAALAAREKMLQANLSLVLTMAKKYAHATIPLADIVQVWNIGLLRAIEGFDPERGVKFSTYATQWIRKNMSELIAKNDKLVYVPRQRLEDARKINNFINTYTKIHGLSPSNEEISQSVGINKTEIDDYLTDALPVGSLDYEHTSAGGESVNLLGTLTANRYAEPEVLASVNEIKRIIQDILDWDDHTLTPKEKSSIILAFWLFWVNEIRTAEIGEQEGISHESVRQRVTKAVRKLRKRLEESGLDIENTLWIYQ